jgi:seryl-tRNA synthetase
MLDRRFIRENPGAVKAAVRVKGIGLDVDELLRLDQQTRELQREMDDANARRKSLAKEFGKSSEERRAELRAESSELDERIRKIRDELSAASDSLQSLLLMVPMIPWAGSPVGPGEGDNVVIKTVGAPPHFEFEPLDHVELLEKRGWAEFARARKVAGERAYALTGDMVLLERALLSYALDYLTAQGMQPISVPALVRAEPLIGTGQFPAHREETYAITADDLYLAGTAEVALVGLHSGEILEHRQLPVRYAGISPCFRREAGSAGRDVRGLLRVHQFEKVEQFVICVADDEESDRWHARLLDAAEHLLQGLGLHYEVMECSTGDMGAGKYRMNDINTWFPSLGTFRETHSCSSLHDWQARRANLRYRDEEGNVRFAYTLNNTALATPRLLAALVENFQTHDHQVTVPEVLRPYLGGRDLLLPGSEVREAAGRRTLRVVELQASRIAERSGRPLSALTRRDVAMALLSVPPDDAIESLPGIRRALLAVGNPLSAAFWESAESILARIEDADATFGDVNSWLEATGTEPTGMIGLHMWDDPAERSPLQEEMHTRLVMHLEEQLAAGRIDPDGLVRDDAAARRAYLAIQEQWMTSPLPDGRVPMTVLLDEQDEQLFADWEAADREALEALEQVLRKVGDRAVPSGDLAAVTDRVRTEISGRTADGRMLAAFGGVRADALPPEDAELWLILATGIVEPEGDPAEYLDEAFDEDWDLDDEDYDREDPISQAMASVAALDHFDWLAVMSSLVAGGPGTPASASDLAGYVRRFDPDSEDDDDPEDDDLGPADEDLDDLDDLGEVDGEEFDFDALDDELAIEGLFSHILPLWQALGAVDSDDRLTPLGWWGLPEALKRAWSSS